MADVINKTTMEYRRSVNTPDYDPEIWSINPDLSGVKGVEQRYWKLVDGKSVAEMSVEEKSVVDAANTPPRTLWPYEFQALLTDDQLVAIQLATAPMLIRMRTKIQTIVSPMPFDESSELYRGVLLLGQAIPELFTPSEVARILAGNPPE